MAIGKEWPRVTESDPSPTLPSQRGVYGHNTRPLRILQIATHPVQYAAPLFELLAKDSRVQMEVAYCSLQGAEAEVDRDFGVAVQWDIPLLEGYRWKLLRNWPGKPKLGVFWGLCNPGVWRLISRGKFDAVVVYTGYRYSTFWMAFAAARWHGARFIFGTDAHSLSPRDARGWKSRVKRWLWPRLFGLADVVIVPSSGGVNLMRSLGIREDKIVLTPYCVDNAWWLEQSDRVNRAQVRKKWNIPEEAVVLLFCAKLQDWKRPQDLLRAFGALCDRSAFLVFAGDGALRSALEAETLSLGVSGRVRFLGFVNQSGLPDVYSASDVLVLPSIYEPFGVVVNEAMLCKCAVIVSDQVGARFDLVSHESTGLVFPARDVDALRDALSGLIGDPERLQKLRQGAFERICSWAPEVNCDALIRGIETAIHAPKSEPITRS
jgi:glycosyltransferase involved in cell wall biosynthesis